MQGTLTLHKWGILQTYAAILTTAFLFASCGGGSGGGQGVGNNSPGTGSSPPAILSVSPNTGPVSGGEHIIVKGTDFVPEEYTRVIFDGDFASDVNVIDSETITCVTPPHTEGIVDVTVINKFGSDTLPGAFAYTSTPSILWLDCEKVRNRITFRWKLSEPGDSIIFFRGKRATNTMGGNVEFFVYEEAQLGLFRYTVALYKDGQRIDQRDVIIDFGRVVWEPPASGIFTGFYLYVVEAIHNDPYQLLPYENPEDFDFDCGNKTEIPLSTLYQNTLISGRTKYYAAVSSYYGRYPRVKISSLSPPVTFYCFVEIEMP